MSYDYSQQKKLIQTSEYSCLKEIENMLNGSFNFKNFAACLPGNIVIDDRNRASYEMCRDLAETLRNRHLPLI